MSATATQPEWSLPLSIETPIDELERLMGLLTRTERRLFDQGVTCPFKDRPEFSCLACPFSKAEDRENSPKRHLCRVGCDQERVATLLIAQHAQDGIAG